MKGPATYAPVAVVDVGSHALLGLVAARGDGGRPIAVAEWARFGRLGEGLGADGALTRESLARNAELLDEFATFARHHGALRVDAVGTSALRRASNAGALVARAASSGVTLTVIDGGTEAALTFAGAMGPFEHDGAPYCVVDVGGGSTELAVGAGTVLARSASLEVGSVRLQRAYFSQDRATPAEMMDATRAIDDALDDAGLTLPARLVALAGTAWSVAALIHDLDDATPDAVHGRTVPRGALDALVARLAGTTAEERRSMPGVPAERAPYMTAGALVLARVAARAAAPSIAIARGGVRFGLAARALDHQGA